jgi:hypothetical protein
MRNVIIAAILAASASPALASDWRLLEANGSSTYYVDAQHITRSGRTVRFWEEIRHALYKDGKTNRDVSLVLANCDDKSYEESEVLFYHDGQSLSRGDPVSRRFAPPDSIIFSLIDKVCSGLP